MNTICKKTINSCRLLRNGNKDRKTILNFFNDSGFLKKKKNQTLLFGITVWRSFKECEKF